MSGQTSMDEPLAMRRTIADAQQRVLGAADRLHSAPAPDLVATAFAAELEQQDQLFEGIGLADVAHTIMLVEARVIPSGQGAALLSFLLKLQSRPRDFVPDPALGDLYTNREAWLSARTSASGWLGAGRARREATTTGYLITVRERLLEMMSALIEAGQAIADCAERHRDSLMPDYTYLQVSQPTTFAHFVSGFGCALTRDLDRARALFARVNLSPAGCGSSNGSSFAQDRERLAALLGFDGLVRHARDAMWEADLPIEALGVATAAVVNLDRLAEDLMVFSTAEFGFVELADAHARTSKIMPQKKNPYALGYIRAVANRLIGMQAAMAACGRTPSGQVDNRMQASADVAGALHLAAGAARLMGKSVAGLTFNHARARHALDSSFAFATDLAELIMTRAGVDFRTAHSLVARLIRDMVDSGARGSRVASADLDAVAAAAIGRPLGLTQQELDQVSDPAAAVSCRTGIGGASRDAVSVAINECRGVLAGHAEWLAATKDRLAAGKAALLALAERMAEGA
jgi:argininosuccinate lyase